MRHREAWAEAVQAPTREQWALEQAEAAARAASSVEERTVNDGNESNAPAGGGEVSKEVLIVVSKLKAYIKAKSGMNTSDAIVPVLSELVRRICDQAIESARSDGRKTVLDRDVKSGPG
jgi:hypothetical protein